MTQDLNTLICLFHSREHAHRALEEILKSGIPDANVTLVGDAGSTIASSLTTLTELNVPERDRDRLLHGIERGGAVVTVSALSAQAETVEAIFSKYAEKIDEATVPDDMSSAALPSDQDLLVTEDVYAVANPQGGLDEVHVLTATPVETVPAYPLDSVDENGAPDTDPRDLGLDPRMNPRQVQ